MAKLLCIDDSRGPGSNHFINWIEAGETYTLRRKEGSFNSNEQRILLKEVKNPPVYIQELFMKVEPGFRASRFVEIDDEVMENSNTKACAIEE